MDEKDEYKNFYNNIFDFIFDIMNMNMNMNIPNTLNIVIGFNVLNGNDIYRFLLNNTNIPIHVAWDHYTSEEIEIVEEKEKNGIKILNQDFNDLIKDEVLDFLYKSISNENFYRIDNIIFDHSTTKNLTGLSCLVLLYHFLKKEGSIYIPFSTIKPITINRDKTVSQSYLYGWNIQTYYDNKEILSELFPQSLIEVYNSVDSDLCLLTKDNRDKLVSKKIDKRDYQGFCHYPLHQAGIFIDYGAYYKITKLKI